MKRPPPQPLQSTVNGIHSVTSSPSPLLSSKRPPSDTKQQSSHNATAGGGTAAVSQRASNRQRKDTGKSGEGQGRAGRINSVSARAAAAAPAEQNKSKQQQTSLPPPQPYGKPPSPLLACDSAANIIVNIVQTSEYILRKFRGRPPSLMLHLYPTHFRFDQQEGGFGYSSPMRVLLEHIKAATVPHDMLEELLAANVTFYDGSDTRCVPKSGSRS
jgi:transcription factor SPT20